MYAPTPMAPMIPMFCAPDAVPRITLTSPKGTPAPSCRHRPRRARERTCRATPRTVAATPATDLGNPRPLPRTTRARGRRSPSPHRPPARARTSGVPLLRSSHHIARKSMRRSTAATSTRPCGARTRAARVRPEQANLYEHAPTGASASLSRARLGLTESSSSGDAPRRGCGFAGCEGGHRRVGASRPSTVYARSRAPTWVITTRCVRKLISYCSPEGHPGCWVISCRGVPGAQGRLVISAMISGTMMRAAASMRARCENAWGKFPRWRPVSTSNSSA